MNLRHVGYPSQRYPSLKLAKRFLGVILEQLGSPSLFLLMFSPAALFRMPMGM